MHAGVVYVWICLGFVVAFHGEFATFGVGFMVYTDYGVWHYSHYGIGWSLQDGLALSSVSVLYGN